VVHQAQTSRTFILVVLDDVVEGITTELTLGLIA
jgi:hypothetical protein